MEIKVDSVKYKVKYKKIKANYMGHVAWKKALIEIDNTMPKELQEKTLFHECTHIILDSIGESTLNNNEEFVERLGNAFYRLIKDNPEII